MNRAEMEQIAEEAAKKALTQMFLMVGVDVSDPESIIEFQTDLKHVRAWRKSTQTVRDHALKTAIGVVVSGFLGWIGLILWKHQ
jgi:hypothetical protein